MVFVLILPSSGAV